MHRPLQTCRTIPPSGWSSSYGRQGDERTVQLPLTVARSQDVATLVTVNFGRIVAGHVELEVEAPPGVRLDLFYQESADYDATAAPARPAPPPPPPPPPPGFWDHPQARRH